MKLLQISKDKQTCQKELKMAKKQRSIQSQMPKQRIKNFFHLFVLH